MSRDHTPIRVAQFNGLFDRGEDDVCPPDHFLTAKNIWYTQDGPRTRDGLALKHTINGVLRMALYKRTNEVPRTLILTTGGNLYDSLNLSVPILTIEDMIDFDSHDFGNRVYITPHNGERALPNEVVYVYDGVTCRPAGGAAPSGVITATESAFSGNIDAGTHIIAVAYETESGFVTKPGPAIYATFVASGSNSVDISGIPVGPSEVVARRILATRRIPVYNGDQNAFEFYYVPTGRIGNNTDTTVTLNFYDADLQQSADYLFDQLQTIPACLSLSVYKDRLVFIGNYDEPSQVYYSRTLDPESVDAVEGYQTFDESETGGVRAGGEFRDSFYVQKQLKTYMTTEREGFNPIFWGKPITIDGGIGTECHGLSMVLDTNRTNTDRFVLASRTGLMIFDGVYQDPELSWKIGDVWNRINKDLFRLVQVFTDPVHKIIYIFVPLGNDEECYHCLVCDYQNGLGAMSVRWSIWEFPEPVKCIALDVLSDNAHPYLIVGLENNVYYIEENRKNDFGNAIETIMKTASLTYPEFDGVAHFDSLRLRVRGSGNLQIKLYSEDNVITANLVDLPLQTLPGKEFTRLSNFINERCAVELKTDQFGEYFNINKLVLHALPLWAERPSE